MEEPHSGYPGAAPDGPLERVQRTSHGQDSARPPGAPCGPPDFGPANTSRGGAPAPADAEGLGGNLRYRAHAGDRDGFGRVCGVLEYARHAGRAGFLPLVEGQRQRNRTLDFLGERTGRERTSFYGLFDLGSLEWGSGRHCNGGHVFYCCHEPGRMGVVPELAHHTNGGWEICESIGLGPVRSPDGRC